MNTRNLGPLECVLTGGTDGNGGGDGPVIVLMHGFGAPGRDLVPLAGAMDVPENTRFVFPAAPLAMPPEYGDGRAWWMIDMQRMQMAMMMGKPRNLADEYPPELPEVRSAMLEMLEMLDSELGAQKVVLGGFSQGSMLACDIALHTERPLAGLILLSSALLARDWWLPKIASRSGLPVYQSHGTADPVLPMPGGEALRDALSAGGLEVEFETFRGAHEIPLPVLRSASAFATRVLSS